MVPVPLSKEEWNRRSDSCLVPQKDFRFQFWKSHPVWLIIPIPDCFPPKNIFQKILVLVQVLGTGEGH